MAEPVFKCKVCGADTDLASDDGETFCHEHCPDHEYENDSCAGHAMCVTCGAPAPDDYYYSEDDVPIFGTMTEKQKENLGTPLSELTAARFAAIGRSWGYD